MWVWGLVQFPSLLDTGSLVCVWALVCVGFGGTGVSPSPGAVAVDALPLFVELLPDPSLWDSPGLGYAIPTILIWHIRVNTVKTSDKGHSEPLYTPIIIVLMHL